MIKQYRLINIGEKKDETLNSMILWVELAPVKINELLDEYTFFESEKESFIFLLDQNQVDYFLNNPEEIKDVNLDDFEKGNATLPDGTNVELYKHQDYLKEFRSIRNQISLSPFAQSKIQEVGHLTDAELETAIEINQSGIETAEKHIKTVDDAYRISSLQKMIDERKTVLKAQIYEKEKRGGWLDII